MQPVRTFAVYGNDGRLAARVMQPDKGEPAVVADDPKVKAGIEGLLAEPAAEWFGGSDGGVMWDGVRILKPGEPGHVAAVVDSLAKLGLRGEEEVRPVEA